jgi:hypothetical protein
MNQVMRRKPCASHWVTKPCLVAYSPSSLVFCCGTMRETVSSTKASGTSGITSRSGSSEYMLSRSRVPSIDTDISSSSSPSSASGAFGSAAFGLRRTRSFAAASAWSARMSTSSST